MDRGRVLDSRVGNFLTSESEIEIATETTCRAAEVAQGAWCQIARVFVFDNRVRVG